MMSSRSGVKGQIAKAALTASLIAACTDILDADSDGGLSAPDATAEGNSSAASGTGFDASMGNGGNAAGGIGNAGGAAGAAAGTAPVDAADSDESAERDAGVASDSRGETDANSPPVAADGKLVVVEGSKKSGHLPSSDADGDALVHRIVTAPVLGSVRITNATTGEFEYSSNNGTYGTDSFTYQVSDQTSNAPLAGTIDITVVALGPLSAETDVVPITDTDVGLGRAVDVEGDTAVAGAWWWGTFQGAVYVMRRNSSGAWKVIQRIVEAAPAEFFGQQVALTGDWLIVTAARVNDSRHGAAYFYKRPHKDAPFAFKKKFQAPSPAADDQYGSALAVDGDLAVIAARGNPLAEIPDGGTDIPLRGAAYVYRRNAADEWRLEQAIESPYREDERFGFGVGVNGDTLAVSSGLKPDPLVGRVHFFARENQQWKLKTTFPRTGSRGVGESIGVYGDNILVSNPDTYGGGGHVETYTREVDEWRVSGNIWGPEREHLPGFGGVPVDFGYPVVMHGDTAVITAFLTEPFPRAYVYHYLRSGTPAWSYAGRKLVPGQRVSDQNSEFGYAVAFDGTTAIIGAPADWSTPVQGAVYFFGIAPP